ncbi:Uncharacterised protein [Listeria grayi]|nr:Uncharacterised protein [Listeria grayi]
MRKPIHMDGYIFSLIKILVVLGALAGISYFLVKKNRQSARLRKSENGKILLQDTLYVSNQLKVLLLEVEGQKMMTVISNNNVQTTPLTNKANTDEKFSEMLSKEERKVNV